jgi:EF-P beta-lysylation protein EpmB
MANIITSKSVSKEDWLQQVANAVTDLDELLQILCLEESILLHRGRDARYLFSLRVPHKFISLMKKGDPNDPLLLQVITSYQEFDTSPEYNTDPLGEQNGTVPGLLHKYSNRALLIVKGGCAVNCRYCFRRHFPYQKNQGGKQNWERAINYVSTCPSLDEIILSGGDPLMAKDRELQWIIKKIEAVPHIKRLRIHSRLPVVIPDRITVELCQLLKKKSPTNYFCDTYKPSARD